MTAAGTVSVVLIACAIGVLAYLVAALVYPERF